MEDFSENQFSFLNVTGMNPSQMFEHPLHPYHKVLSAIRNDNKELPLQLVKHLKAGRSKRAIQQIDKELKTTKNFVLANNLRALKSTISNMISYNSSRVGHVKLLTSNTKTLKSLKNQTKEIPHKDVRRNMKRRYNSDIANLSNQLNVIDHKKHNKRKRWKVKQSQVVLRICNLAVRLETELRK